MRYSQLLLQDMMTDVLDTSGGSTRKKYLTSEAKEIEEAQIEFEGDQR